jgi:hypothetical protein
VCALSYQLARSEMNKSTGCRMFSSVESAHNLLKAAALVVCFMVRCETEV